MANLLLHLQLRWSNLPCVRTESIGDSPASTRLQRKCTDLFPGKPDVIFEACLKATYVCEHNEEVIWAQSASLDTGCPEPHQQDDGDEDCENDLPDNELDADATQHLGSSEGKTLNHGVL